MELLLVLLGVMGLAIAGGFAGADSRPRIDDRPYRSI